jgi:hypothetical protein
LVVVVVVDVVGAIGIVVVDCSVVVVLVTFSGPPQPATKAMPVASAMPIRNLRPNFVSVMGNSVLKAFQEITC